jgi:hypothetical protein
MILGPEGGEHEDDDHVITACTLLSPVNCFTLRIRTNGGVARGRRL